MLHIKTIIYDFIQDSVFDNKVNEALAEGWELKRRDLVQRPNSGFILYAELEKDDEEEDDRLCETCAHQFKEPQEQPCIECDGDCSRWEPKNLEKPQKAEAPEEEEICEACMIHYDDEPKAEEEKDCDNCKHAKEPQEQPCLSCHDYNKWEPEEEEICEACMIHYDDEPKAEEKRACYLCRHRGVVWGEYPCRECKGFRTKFSKWEPIEEDAEKKSCLNCKHTEQSRDDEPCLYCQGAVSQYCLWALKTEEKSCANCKHKRLDEYDEPCIYCKGMTTKYSKWEPIA